MKISVASANTCTENDLMILVVSRVIERYKKIPIKIKKSGLSSFLFFFLIFYFLFDLFSSFLFLELRVRVSHMNTRKR